MDLGNPDKDFGSRETKLHTHHCNGVRSQHLSRCENCQIRDIGQNVQKCDDGQRQVNGARQIDEGIFEFLRHKIQVVPAGVRVDTRIKGQANLARLRFRIGKCIVKVFVSAYQKRNFSIRVGEKTAFLGLQNSLERSFLSKEKKNPELYRMYLEIKPRFQR